MTNLRQMHCIGASNVSKPLCRLSLLLVCVCVCVSISIVAACIRLTTTS